MWKCSSQVDCSQIALIPIPHLKFKYVPKCQTGPLEFKYQASYTKSNVICPCLPTMPRPSFHLFRGPSSRTDFSQPAKRSSNSRHMHHALFLSPLTSSLPATLSLSASLTTVLFNRCGGHLPPFEGRPKLLAGTPSTLSEVATLEPAYRVVL